MQVRQRQHLEPTHGERRRHGGRICDRDRLRSPCSRRRIPLAFSQRPMTSILKSAVLLICTSLDGVTRGFLSIGHAPDQPGRFRRVSTASGIQLGRM